MNSLTLQSAKAPRPHVLGIALVKIYARILEIVLYKIIIYVRTYVYYTQQF